MSTTVGGYTWQWDSPKGKDCTKGYFTHKPKAVTVKL